MGYFSRNTEWNYGLIEADVDQDREKCPSLLLRVGAVLGEGTHPRDLLWEHLIHSP